MQRLDGPETLDQLSTLVQTALWLRYLGERSGSESSVLWIDAETWKQHIRFTTAAEFGVPSESCPSSVPEYQWLPTSASQEDPIHQGTLLTKISGENKADLLKATRRELSQAVLSSLRSATAPLLKVGATSLVESAKGAALFAVRMAATELVAGQPGFWCSVMPLYHAGHWPFGRSARDRRLLVL